MKAAPGFKFIAALALAGALGACQPLSEGGVAQSSVQKAGDTQYYPSNAYIDQAKISFHNSDYGLAEINFRKAVELEPKDVEAWLGLAATYDELRRFDLADGAYKKVLAMMPRNAIVYNNAGYSQLLRGNLVKARELLARAAELEPNNPLIINNVVLLGQSEKSIKRTVL